VANFPIGARFGFAGLPTPVELGFERLDSSRSVFPSLVHHYQSTALNC
jgi:hypothetical protein